MLLSVSKLLNGNWEIDRAQKKESSIVNECMHMWSKYYIVLILLIHYNASLSTCTVLIDHWYKVALGDYIPDGACTCCYLHFQLTPQEI
jgi:hypothetical protein